MLKVRTDITKSGEAPVTGIELSGEINFKVYHWTRDTFQTSKDRLILMSHGIV